MTRFTVTMEFEIEVQGGRVEPVSVGREAAAVSRDVAGMLVKALSKTTGRKSLGIPESSCGIGKTKCVMPGEEAPDPFLPVTEKALRYGRKYETIIPLQNMAGDSK